MKIIYFIFLMLVTRQALAYPFSNLFSNPFANSSPNSRTDSPTNAPIDTSCSDVDLRADMGPIRNQSDKGWCFANVGADLLTAAHKDQMNGQQVSASYTAINYFFTDVFQKTKKIDSVFGDSGGIYDAMNVIIAKQRLCLQANDNKMMSRGLPGPLSSKLAEFKLLYDQYQLYKKTRDAKQILATRDQLAAANSFLSDYSQSDIINALDKPTLDEAAYELVNLICRDSSVITNKQVQFQFYYLDPGSNGMIVDGNTQFYTNNVIFMNEINKSLSRGKPVAFSYKVEQVLTTPAIASGYHASIIAGRRFNKETQTCEYIVRNSWGDACETYINQNGSIVKVDIYKGRCMNGNYILSFQELLRITEQVIFQKM